ncbi:MAG: hypothetical protein OXO48_01690, partial [Caldilineaceae bacterium]|nr:hypothetical protein [Caldilineaceae bacterium]
RIAADVGGVAPPVGGVWGSLIACEASTAPAWADCALMRTFEKKSATFGHFRPLSASYGRIAADVGGVAPPVGGVWGGLIACEASTAPAWADCAFLRTHAHFCEEIGQFRPYPAVFWLNCTGRGRCEGRNLPRLE